MIFPSNRVRIMVATKPVDFRKGHYGLAALVKNEQHKDPFTGTVFVFRSRKADRLKLIYWDGSGIVLAYKRLEEHSFTGPGINARSMPKNACRIGALLAEPRRRPGFNVSKPSFHPDRHGRDAELSRQALGEQPDTADQGHAIVDQLHAAGLDHTINNLWILGWLGGYDKRKMADRVLKEHYGLDIGTDRDAVLYVGDSTNDAPMFSYFRHTVAISTIVRYLDEIDTPPAWVTKGPGGEGFVEAAEAVLRARAAGRPLSGAIRDDLNAPRRT